MLGLSQVGLEQWWCGDDCLKFAGIVLSKLIVVVAASLESCEENMESSSSDLKTQ